MKKISSKIIRYFLFAMTVMMSLAFIAQQGVSAAPLAAPADDFVFTVDTTQTGSSGTNGFVIPTAVGSTYNFDVDCNDDGTYETLGSTTAYTCDYTTLGGPGTYTIRIRDASGTGTGFPRIQFNLGGDQQKVLSVVQWGTGHWTSMFNAFRDCSNLTTVSATDAPDLSGVTSLSNMFRNATAFNGDIGGWNTSSITTMANMFYGASAFNGDIGGWNTGSVTNMASMFYGASVFNQDISGWNTGSVTTMNYMFYNASAFNQNIGGWNTSGVSDMAGMFRNATAFNQDIGGWVTGSVTTMANMFDNAIAFNQDIGGWVTGSVTGMQYMFDYATAFNQDISGWNTSGVSNMASMFYNATAFNQDIGGWNTGSVTNMNFMFYNASAFDQDLGGWDVSTLLNATGMFGGIQLSTVNYDALLIGWDAQALNPNVVFSGGSSNYCNGETARANMTSPAPGDGWTITDGGLNCDPDLEVQRPVSTAIADGGADDIGDQPVGVVTLSYTIDNIGPSTVDVTGVTASNFVNVSGFAASTTFPLSIALNGTGTVEISFTVDAVGSFSFDLEIANNVTDKDPYNISVTGVGTSAPEEVEEVEKVEEAVVLPVTGFAPGVVTALPAQPAEKVYASSDIVLSIPSQGVEMAIVGVPMVGGGWDTTWLGTSAGWLEGSAFPTLEGNTVLTGHVWDANNNPGPFAGIKDLHYGDTITIQAWGATYTYEVRGSTLVFPSNVSKVFQHEEFDYLTLLTCEFYNSVNGEYLYRRMVSAVLVGVE